MIIADLNLLIHAYNSDFPRHGAAKQWWEDTLNSGQHIGLAWAVVLGFIRITTSRSVLARPLRITQAAGIARSWLSLESVRIVVPGEEHAKIVFSLLEEIGTAGNLTTDAHLAALALEYRAELATTDVDFARFPGLRWFNPLAGKARKR